MSVRSDDPKVIQQHLAARVAPVLLHTMNSDTKRLPTDRYIQHSADESRTRKQRPVGQVQSQRRARDIDRRNRLLRMRRRGREDEGGHNRGGNVQTQEPGAFCDAAPWYGP